MKPVSSFVCSAVIALALGALAGCSGAGSDEEADDSALTAGETNQAQYNLKDHKLTSVAASDENQKALGIKTWDLFVGVDAKSGFRGAVFYASDANGDVRYAFASDVNTKQITFAVLEKDGKQADMKVDEEAYKKLMADVIRLRDQVKPATSGSGTSHVSSNDDGACLKTLAYGALFVVVGIGATYVSLPALGLAAYAGMGGGAASTAAIGGILGADALAAGYAVYKVAKSFEDDVVDSAAKCVLGDLAGPMPGTINGRSP